MCHGTNIRLLHPGGEIRLDAFKRVVALPSLKQTGAKMKWNGFGKGEVWVALLTFLYIDFLDTTGGIPASGGNGSFGCFQDAKRGAWVLPVVLDLV
jgi:hypothetical protein